MQKFTQIFINGSWCDSAGDGEFEVINSSTEEVMGAIPRGNARDVDRAVAAAGAAFPGWAATARRERADLLRRLSAGLSARSEQLAETIAGEVGMPIKLARMIQAGLPLMVLGNFAELTESYPLEQTIGSSLVIKEPIGVVGAITPWNYPLHQVIAKLAPALGAGCTFVLKPSEVAPLSAFILAEVFAEIGAPPGIFNLVSGDGPSVGEALAAHPGVDMLSFTGSTRAGRRVAELAAQNIKRVTLELGGKSANVILDDADLSRAVSSGVGACYLNSGQTCSALTRMLVPREKQEEAVAIAKATAEKFTLGNAVEGAGKLGPLVSANQRDRVRNYIRKGIEEGATLVTGGPEAPEGLPRGFFVRPTVFADVDNSMTIAREEIFGPVLCIMPYTDEAEAIRIANDSPYGLAGAVWSADLERAKRVARALRTGQVEINGGAFNPAAPFGGYKQSGNGREYGEHGFGEFLEVKSLQL